MAFRATLLAMLLACQAAPAAAPVPPAKPDATKLPQGTATQDPPPAAQGVEAAPECVDKELQKRGLDKYGGEPGTMYPGGTPLFQESTGKRKDRAQYVYAKHPDIAKACGAPDAGP